MNKEKSKKRCLPTLIKPKASRLKKRDKDNIVKNIIKIQDEMEELTIIKSSISLYSYEDMLRLGVVNVESKRFEGNGTVNDNRFGTIEANTACTYCSLIDCPGHYGIIKFENTPIYNPSFIRQIVSILTCVCNTCGKLLITEEMIKEKGFNKLVPNKRLDEMEKFCKDLPCLRENISISGGRVKTCSKNPRFLTTDIKDKGEITFKKPKEKGKKKQEGDDIVYKMTVQNVLNILESISDEDAYLLGFPKPKSIRKVSKESIYNILNKISYHTLVRFGFPNNKSIDDLEYEDILLILEKLNQKNLKELGFTTSSHPRNMIMKAVLVPPLIARPHVYENGNTHFDQLTSAYANLAGKINNPHNQITSNEIYNMLKGIVFKNDTKTSDREFSSIIDRIQGKGAVLRNLLMGKRVNYCGRTVAGPCASLKFGQIRIPKIWESVLTKKIKVNNININFLTNLLHIGKITHITSKKTGLRQFYKDDSKYQLEIGDIVDRHLLEGDRVIVNRQPTLHRQSMMSYEVVFGHQLNIGLHLSYTSPMNCDFDGDENNVWNPQDFEVEAESDILINVKNNLMSSEQNRPSMGLVMNSVTGAYLLTTPFTVSNSFIITSESIDAALLSSESDAETDFLQSFLFKYINRNLSQVFKFITPLQYPFLYKFTINNNAFNNGTIIDDDLFNELLSFITNKNDLISLNYRLNKYGIHPRSGAALFSALLPPSFSYIMKNIVIIDGILISGRITKSHIGPSHRSIIQEIYKSFGSQRTCDFFTDAPIIINKWLMERGFSVGLLDCINFAIDENGKEYDKNKRILQQELAKIYIELEALGGILSDPIEETFRQRQINNLVNIASGIGLRLAKEILSNDNSIGVMTDQGAGTKGGIANIGQMMGSVGQQFYLGERLKPAITNNTRLLPTFDINDHNPEANAFIPESFYTGISPEGLFFSQAGGREGLLDTALKTAETGHMQHRMIKAFENIIIAYDGSIRNTIGTMFSPIYNSGFDISELVTVPYKHHKEFSSFIDLKATASSLNIKNGWVPSSIKSTISNNLSRNPSSPSSPPPSSPPSSPPSFSSSPFITKLTKFEKSRIIGTRATQLSNNSPPLIDPSLFSHTIDPVKIATLEYFTGILPIYIIRKFPDGSIQHVFPTLDNI